jgi:hypothetical protein
MSPLNFWEILYHRGHILLRNPFAYLLPLIDHSRFAASFCFDVWPLITAAASLDIQHLVAANSSFGIRV